MTYADNLAFGYFKKQGFSQAIRMLPERWQGYINHYGGGTMMECSIHPTIKYTCIHEIIKRQKEFILKKIKERAITKYELDTSTLL